MKKKDGYDIIERVIATWAMHEERIKGDWFEI